MNQDEKSIRKTIIDNVLKLQDIVRFIPIHKETIESMELWTDEQLSRYHAMLYELKTRIGGK